MTNNSFSRRDFLKLISLIPAAVTVKPLAKLTQPIKEPQPHIIIIVYDAWSARNTSLYGYPRPTMPNLEKFAQKAIVYHRHYAAGNFTVPGTASLLTGVYPWKHRAYSIGGKIAPDYQDKQIFNFISSSLKTIGYAQNKYADLLLFQAGKDLQKHFRNNILNLDQRMAYSLPFFSNDAYIAFSSLDKTVLTSDNDYSGSIFLGPLYQTDLSQSKLDNLNKFPNFYIDGLLPESDEQFLLSDVVDGTIQILKNLTEPSFVYIHLFPPHEPFCPNVKFLNSIPIFPETLIDKKSHRLSNQFKSFDELKQMNFQYDAYLATWDNEVSRLYEYFEASGIRENSYIFLTSDHGEIFERGEAFHMTPLLNDPVVHIPLIISVPGVENQQNFYSTTSAVDILPTIANIMGLPNPEWTDGHVLPGFGEQIIPDRGVFSLEAKKHSSHYPLTDFSVSLTNNNMRLILYQYNNKRQFELYDLQNDPEEMSNIDFTKSKLGARMKEELLAKVAEFSTPWVKKTK